MTASPFDKAFAEKEAAMLKRRSVLDKADAALNGAGKKVSVPTLTPVAGPKSININGVDIASLDYVEDRLDALRDDLNEVLEGIEKGGNGAAVPVAAPPVVVNIMSDGAQVGQINGLTHCQIPELTRLCAIPGINILIRGDMGGGKSTAVKQIAEARGLEFRYTSQTNMPHDVLGYIHPISGEYITTQFVETFVNGGLWAGEEMDGWSANATLAINPALANGYITLPNGVTHTRHPDCVIVACTNTWGTGPTAEYVGRNKLDDAFLDRFGARLDWKYDLDLERAVAGNDRVVDIVQTARRNAREAGIRVVISPRASIDVSKMVAAGFSIREALGMNFLSALSADQRKVILAGCEL